MGVAASMLGAAQSFPPQGTEYVLSRGLLGDQTKPAVSLNRQGGFVVWQDNAIDGDGLGVGAAALNNYLSPIPTKLFRVNEKGAGDQENPVVQVLRGGGAIFVWQGGAPGQQDIWARILGTAGTFTSGDFLVNSHTAGQQADPAVALLADGNVVVTWSSLEQDGNLQGVFGQILSPSGGKVGGEFQVNQFAPYNQRTSSVAALEGGGFVVAWVSEQQRFINSVDVYGRRYDAAGGPQGSEFRLNATTNLCANPVLCGVPGGGFLASWSQRDLAELNNGWDVMAQAFGATGQRVGGELRVNTCLPENQFRPKLAGLGNVVVIVWTSRYQDGSREGVYGRFVGADGTLLGDEFRVNTTTISQQIEPAAASDGDQRFLVVWSSFSGLGPGFEIMGQRYALDQTVNQPAPPLVSALDSYSLLVSWPPLAGYTNVAAYRLQVDGEASPRRLTANFCIIGDLEPGSLHVFKLAYELNAGQITPFSEAAAGTTWGRDRNFDGLPDDWQTKYWGADNKQWPLGSADGDGDGASNLEEFLAGTDPVRAESVLRITIRPTTGGLLVQWDAVAGSVYQLQSAGDLRQWTDVGSPQFAVGSSSSLVLSSAHSAAYYRVFRIR
jgi:hypothetical protein